MSVVKIWLYPEPQRLLGVKPFARWVEVSPAILRDPSMLEAVIQDLHRRLDHDLADQMAVRVGGVIVYDSQAPPADLFIRNLRFVMVEALAMPLRHENPMPYLVPFPWLQAFQEHLASLWASWSGRIKDRRRQDDDDDDDWTDE